jgi:hypothetical protein
VKLGERLESGRSDTEIVTAALGRRIIQGILNGFDPSDEKSVFVPLTTATIPVCVESCPTTIGLADSSSTNLKCTTAPSSTG